MKIDLLNTFAWDETNELVQSQFPKHLPAGGSLRVYAGLSQAIFEIAFGTALLFSHKKNMAVIGGNTWAFEGILPHLYKEGFQVQDEKMAKVTDWSKYLEGLKKETSFVLWSEDDPVFASYRACEELDQALNAQRIFSIRVSHSAHHYRATEVRPFSLRICSISPTLTLAQCGSKFRAPPIYAHRSFWNPQETLATLQVQLAERTEDVATVEKFEATISQKTVFRPVLQTRERIFDRAVVYHPEINSDSVQRVLKEKLKQKFNPPMFEEQAEILNQCRWSPAPHLRAWWDPLPSEEVIRGLLVLSLKTIQEPQFIDWIAEGEKGARITLG